MMRTIGQDFRYALRRLRNAPGFALAAICVLALGMGANVAVFTLISGIMLRPLPLEKPDHVVAVQLSGPQPYYTLNYSNMVQLRDAVGPRLKFGALLYGGPQNASVVTASGRFQVACPKVTAGLFDMLGVRPVIGRGFRSDEDEPGKNRVLLIGYDVWQKLYRGEAAAIGSTLTIRKQPYTIVGVLPKGFFFSYYSEMAVWSPADLPPGAASAMGGKLANWGEMFARLPAGMNAAQLAADLSRVQAVIAREAPDEELPPNIKVTDCQTLLNQAARKPLLLLYAMVAGIWALACLNVAGLLLARAVSSSKEQAVRAALGASRVRLLQQTMMETLVLSGAGALAGLGLGQGAIKLLWRQIRHELPLTNAVHVDWRVVACLICVTVLTAVLCGAAPALRAMRRDVRGDLAGGAATATNAANRTREVLVAGQLALTLVFLVGAGLFLRTIHALREVPLGFTEQNVLTGGIILNGSGGIDDDENAVDRPNVVRDSYEPLLERLKAIPGVQVAALSSVLPMRREMSVPSQPRSHWPFRLDGQGALRRDSYHWRDRRYQADQPGPGHQAGDLLLPGADGAGHTRLRNRHGIHPGGNSRRGAGGLTARTVRQGAARGGARGDDHEGDDDRAGGGGLVRQPDTDGPAAGVIRRACSAHCLCRPVWSSLVHRSPTHARDRRAHRAGGAPGQHHSPYSAARADARRHWPRFRMFAGMVRYKAGRFVYLRRKAPRWLYLHRSRFAVGSRVGTCRLVARAARRAG